MTIRVKHTVAPQISRDTDARQKMFYYDTAASAVVIDTFNKSASGDLSVAVSSTDTLPLGDIVSVKGLYLEVDADCLVRLNGSLDDIQLRAQSGTIAKAKLFIEADITQVEVENVDPTNVLTGVFCVWGD